MSGAVGTLARRHAAVTFTVALVSAVVPTRFLAESSHASLSPFNDDAILYCHPVAPAILWPFSYQDQLVTVAWATAWTQSTVDPTFDVPHTVGTNTGVGVDMAERETATAWGFTATLVSAVVARTVLGRELARQALALQ